MQVNVGKERLHYVDVARFYAMAGVFFGHFIEQIMMLNDPTAAIFYKFVYSFHMVLFFVLSGFIARDSDLGFSVGKFFRQRFFSRIFPFIYLFNKYLPQLVGKPKINGPWLKNFI